MVTNKCGVIDMSWKGKIEVKGPDAQELLEYAVCGEVSGAGDEWETSSCRKWDSNGNGVVWGVENVALAKMWQEWKWHGVGVWVVGNVAHCRCRRWARSARAWCWRGRAESSRHSRYGNIVFLKRCGNVLQVGESASMYENGGTWIWREKRKKIVSCWWNLGSSSLIVHFYSRKAKIEIQPGKYYSWKTRGENLPGLFRIFTSTACSFTYN